MRCSANVLPVLGPCRREQAVNAVTILRVPSSHRDSESACWCFTPLGLVRRRTCGWSSGRWVAGMFPGQLPVRAASPIQLSLLRVKNTPAWGLDGHGLASKGLIQPSLISLLGDGRFLNVQASVSRPGFLASVPWTCCDLLRSRYGQTAGPRSAAHKVPGALQEFPRMGLIHEDPASLPQEKAPSQSPAAGPPP